MAGIREKIEYNDISESFQGTPISTDHSLSDGDRVLWILRINLGGGRQ